MKCEGWEVIVGGGQPAVMLSYPPVCPSALHLSRAYLPCECFQFPNSHISFAACQYAWWVANNTGSLDSFIICILFSEVQQFEGLYRRLVPHRHVDSPHPTTPLSMSGFFTFRLVFASDLSACYRRSGARVCSIRSRAKIDDRVANSYQRPARTCVIIESIEEDWEIGEDR